MTHDPCVPVSTGWTMVTLACRYILSSPIHVKTEGSGGLNTLPGEGRSHGAWGHAPGLPCAPERGGLTLLCHHLSPPELFPDPVLTASPSAEPRAGAAVTLSCRTQLRRERPAGRLLFAFYKGGGALRGWGLSSELQVRAASAAHSGSYWCEATTEDSRVWKRSPELEVRVQGEWCVWNVGAGWWGPELGFGVSCFRKDSGGRGREHSPWRWRELAQGTSPLTR